MFAKSISVFGIAVLLSCSIGCNKWWSSSSEPAPCGTVTVAAPAPTKPEATRLVFEVKVTPEVGSSQPAPQQAEAAKPPAVQVTAPAQPAPQAPPASK